jgi:hypothetical protein
MSVSSHLRKGVETNLNRCLDLSPQQFRSPKITNETSKTPGRHVAHPGPPVTHVTNHKKQIKAKYQKMYEAAKQTYEKDLAAFLSAGVEMA